MNVICKETTSKAFDLGVVTTVFSNDFDYTYGGYGLEMNKEYIVMGMAIYQDANCVYYLVDVNGKPEWFPYLLFEVSDNSLPSEWFVKIYDKKGDSNIYLLGGFNELCNTPNFYRRLLEREEAALQIYFRRKIEIEKGLTV